MITLFVPIQMIYPEAECIYSNNIMLYTRVYHKEATSVTGVNAGNQ